MLENFLAVVVDAGPWDAVVYGDGDDTVGGGSYNDHSSSSSCDSGVLISSIVNTMR